eukprot:3235578-Karenia_brevis.AAC.1
MKKVVAQKEKIKAFEETISETGQDEGGEACGLPGHEVMQIFKMLAEAKQRAVCEWLGDTFFDSDSDTPDASS